MAFKWFHDWKKFQKIQPGRTYAQVLLLEKINQSHVKSGLKEYKLTTHPVTRKVTFNQHSKKFLKTKAHHTRLVKQQRNQVQVSNHGSSVTGVANRQILMVKLNYKIDSRYCKILQFMNRLMIRGFTIFELMLKTNMLRLVKNQMRPPEYQIQSF